jgi:hypothetical protein
MKTISMVEFRHSADKIIRDAMNGERTILTYRDKPAVHPEPIKPDAVRKDNPFYSIDCIAEANAGTLKNSQIDRVIYEC